MKPELTPELKQRFRAYLETHPSWGHLHIALDDGNVRDSDVDFCIMFAAEWQDDEGLALARILRTMSKTQRKKLAGMKL